MSGVKTTKGTDMDVGSVPEPIMAGKEARKEFRASEKSTLPPDAWKQMSDILIQVAQNRLFLVDDLRQEGLIDNVDMGTTISTWKETNKFTEASTDMDALSDTSQDASTYTVQGVPVPIHHKNIKIGRREGDADPELPTNAATKTTRSVMERLEHVMLHGWGDVKDESGENFRIYGYLNHPDRNKYTGNSWDDPTNVERDVRKAIERNEADNYFGPYRLYVNTEAWADLRQPSKDFDNMRVRQQIEELDPIQEVSPADFLPSGQAVLVQMTRDVVDAVAAGDLVQQAEWQRNPFQTNMKIFSIFAPRLKSDEEGQMGLCQLSNI